MREKGGENVMKQNIENGSRYRAVKEALAAESGVVVVREITTDRVNHRKSKLYHEVEIAVAPVDPENAAGFASSLLTDIKPVFRQGEALKTFDTLGEREFRTIHVQVYPNVEAAQDALE
jgi:hypothetical protein